MVERIMKSLLYHKNLFRKLMREERGFTLVELLVAVSIFSLVMMAVYSTFVTGLMVKKKGNQKLQEMQESRRVLDYMHRDIQSMVGFRENSFQGKNKSFTFFRSLEENDDRGNHFSTVVQIKYTVFISDASEANVLRRSVTFFDHDSTEQIFFFFSNYSYEISFNYAVNTRDAGVQWIEEWDDSSEIPLAIRIQLYLKGQDDQVQLKTYSRVIPIPMASAKFGGSDHEI